MGVWVVVGAEAGGGAELSTGGEAAATRASASQEGREGGGVRAVTARQKGPGGGAGAGARPRTGEETRGNRDGQPTSFGQQGRGEM